MIHLGRFLKQRREGLRLSFRKVQLATGLTPSWLCRIEHDTKAKPTPDTLWKLAECYQVSYADLMHLAGFRTDDRDQLHIVKSPVIVGLDRLTEKEIEEVQAIVSWKICNR